MNPYEILGVAIDASETEIQLQFRRQARKAHPDMKGGSAEKMALLNRAHDLLMNPEARARYDTTGKTEAEEELDVIARNMMLSVFNETVNENDPETDMVEEMKRHWDNERDRFNQLMGEQRLKIVHLERVKAKIKRKTEGENFMIGALDNQIAGLTENIEKNTRTADAMGRVLEMLDEYEYDAAPRKAKWDHQPITHTATSFTGGGGFR